MKPEFTKTLFMRFVEVYANSENIGIFYFDALLMCVKIYGIFFDTYIKNKMGCSFATTILDLPSQIMNDRQRYVILAHYKT